MELRESDYRILSETACREKAIAKLKPIADPGPGKMACVYAECASRREQQEDLKRYGPLWDSAEWMGRPQTATEQRALLRAIDRLRDAGLVEVTHRTRRQFHLRLTKAGWEAVRSASTSSV